jgi:hypothetical protein
MEEQCKLQISEENERKKDMIEKLCPHNRIGYCEPCEELKMKEEKCVPWAKQCPETGDWKIMRGMSEVVGAVTVYRPWAPGWRGRERH